MDPLTLIVTALAAGATALQQPSPDQAVAGAFHSLKALIGDRYPTAAAGIDNLERAPASAARRAVVQEDLTAAGAAQDASLLALAQLVLSGQPQSQPEPARVVGVRLSGVQAANIRVQDVHAEGQDTVAGIEATDTRATDAFEMARVQALDRPASPRAQSPAAPPAPAPKITILFLAANPSDTTRLRLGEEVRGIDQALRLAEYRDAFDLQQHWAVRPADLQSLLLRHQPHIVHFSGHGSAAGEIMLEDATGKARSVSQAALSNLFSLLKDNLRVVVLNACYSQPQAEAIAQHIDCVVGMADAIGDKTAIAFVAAFYQALAYGRDLQNAFDLARNQAQLEGLDDEDVPQLLAPNANPAQVAFARP
jgi:hypothetical protein